VLPWRCSFLNTQWWRPQGTPVALGHIHIQALGARCGGGGGFALERMGSDASGVVDVVELDTSRWPRCTMLLPTGATSTFNEIPRAPCSPKQFRRNASMSEALHFYFSLIECKMHLAFACSDGREMTIHRVVSEAFLPLHVILRLILMV
jgi:hypothetical protein